MAAGQVGGREGVAAGQAAPALPRATPRTASHLSADLHHNIVKIAMQCWLFPGVCGWRCPVAAVPGVPVWLHRVGAAARGRSPTAGSNNLPY